MASVWLRPRAPQPMTARTPASALAKYLAATALAAPVRLAVIQVQSMTATGKPVSGSLRMSRPLMVGRPRAGFFRKFPTHLIPAVRGEATWGGVGGGRT